MLKRVSIIIIAIVAGILFTSNSFLSMQEAHAYNKPWDQGHDSTNPDDPDDDDDGCENPPCNECNASGSPVIFIDGSYHAQFVDIELKGKPLVKLKRYYRSKHSFRTGYFGYGWNFSYEMRTLEIAGETGHYVTVLMPNAQTYRFTDNGDGTYQAPIGISMFLSKLASGNFELHEVSGKTYLFDDDGRLSVVTDENGNEIRLSYVNGCIAEISTADGRRLSFTKGANGKISTVTDHTDRSVQYSYDNEGNLTNFTNVSGNTQRYTYQSPHLLTSVTDFLGNVIATVTYDSQGRVVSLTEKGLAYAYTYVDDNTVRRTDIDGTWEYTYNSFGQVISVKDPAGNVEMKTYDSEGRLISQTDSMANTTSYAYDSLGNTIGITDPLGNTTVFTYYAGSILLETKTDSEGMVTRYEYDSRGNIIKQYNAYGASNQVVLYFSYDDKGNLLSKTDGNGYVTTYTYDSFGKRSSETRDGRTTAYEYDKYGNVVRITDPAGNTQQISCDLKARPVSVTDAEGNTTAYTYDANGKQISETNALGYTTTYVPDSNGRLSSIIDLLGNTQDFAYDAKGRLISVTNRNGVTMNSTYNYQGLEVSRQVGGLLTQTYQYDANGNLIAVTDPDGNTTTYTYDANRRKIESTTPGGTTIQFEYDRNGRQTKLSVPATGAQVVRGYDEHGRLTSIGDLTGTILSRSYDTNGSIVSETDGEGNTTTYEYDAFNRVTRKSFPDGSWQSYEYNDIGKVSKVTNSKGETIIFAYDRLGRPVSSTDARGTMYVTYDAVGNIASRTDANGNTTTYEYDTLNRLTKETFANGTTIAYTYYPEGQLQSKTDQNGNTVYYEHNSRGLLTKRDFPGANDDLFTYNGVGKLVTATNSNRSVQITYDADGRVVMSQQGSETITYQYDMSTSEVTIGYPGSRTIVQKFDARGRIDSIVEAGNAIVDYGYNHNDRIVSEQLMNGTSTTYAYAAGKLTKIEYNDGVSNFLEHVLQYNSERQISSEIRGDDNSKTKSYMYDGIGRLTGTQYGTSGSEKDVYMLDGVGNWLSWTRDDTTENRVVNAMNAYTSIGGTELYYDNNGNLTDDGKYMYEYDYMNRIVGIRDKDSGNVVCQYQYDGLGRRFSKTSAGVTTDYFYNQMGQMIEEQIGGATSATYIYGTKATKIHRMDRGGKSYYYHQDIRGSVTKITDGVGSVVEEYFFDAYGNRTVYDSVGSVITESAIQNPFGFAGSLYDSEVGLYYMVNRYYSPGLGRFTSRDPAGYNEGFNLYEYTRSDPINRVDPIGLSSEECVVSNTIRFNAGDKLKQLLGKIKISGLDFQLGGGISAQVKACSKECCSSDGRVTRGYYAKATLQANFSMSASQAVPGYGFSVPAVGRAGLFATISLGISGSGTYAESLAANCGVVPGGEVCVQLAGSVGLEFGAEITGLAIWLQGSIGPSGQVCYGSTGLKWQVCVGASLSAYYEIGYAWVSIGSSFNVLAGQICYETGGWSGAITVFSYEINYGS